MTLAIEQRCEQKGLPDLLLLVFDHRDHTRRAEAWADQFRRVTDIVSVAPRG